jgi:hypothetical protein
MVFAEFKEALTLVGRTPVLWIPGIVAGLLGALLWILYNISGAFFALRLVLITALVMLLFVAGTFALVKKNAGGAGTLLRGGLQYYFRILLPWLVVGFALLLVFILIMIVTVALTGSGTDYEAAGLLAIFVMIPTLFLTFFCDTAAVFEDCKVFASLRRSILVAASHSWQVLGFFIVCCIFAFADLFVFAIIWEGLLLEKLQPLVTYYSSPGYNETALAAMMTPHNIIAMIGTDGMWITAAVIFASMIVLVPVLLAYKACFYRKLIGSPVEIQQTIGEYDSKGRWYKY